MTRRKAIIIGAGPAGLTAALELLRRTDVQPIVLEASGEIGGISRTVRYKGNRMDIGGHRFFSKSDRVMQWWLEMMPLSLEPECPREAKLEEHAASGKSRRLRYQGRERDLPEASAVAVLDLDDSDCPAELPDQNRVMLLRPRKSRIYFLRRLFDYPIRLSADTIRNLGLRRTARAGLSYLWSAAFPRTREVTLEDFLVNRFGKSLFRLFFESYTEKVWGVPCREISAEWGAQRIKGLSLQGVLAHFLKKKLQGKWFWPSSSPNAQADLGQKDTETSLIEQFLYPKLGPGQLWEYVADQVRELGGEIHLDSPVSRLRMSNERGRRAVAAVGTTDSNGLEQNFEADFVISTMPIQDLIRTLSVPAPEEVRRVSEGLIYRDFITVGLLASKLAVHEKDGSPLKDNWIYIQEPDVKLGRLQIFNNWSSAMVADPDNVWLGLEYFCYERDALWQLTDQQMIALAVGEISKIGLLNAADVLDAHVVRVPKTYPAYFGSYDQFDVIRKFVDPIENLFLIGRNGMHKYNNQDHSMLTAMTAVDLIAARNTDKSSLWQINTEMEYHEEAKP